MTRKKFPTTVVGSMPRPQYIKDLVEARVPPERDDADFQRMMDAAVPYVIQMQEAAGVDILSDGEWRRMSYIGVIADICSGFDVTVREVMGQRQTWHTVTGEVAVVNPGWFASEARSSKPTPIARSRWLFLPRTCWARGCGTPSAHAGSTRRGGTSPRRWCPCCDKS